MSSQKEQIDEDFEQLPVIQHRDEILRACQTHQVVICIGETGSGKTTKIPQVSAHKTIIILIYIQLYIIH
jgi:HrpA-like RNA helicase